MEWIVTALRNAGCVAAEEEAAELVEAADRLGVDLGGLVVRREMGEPLAWITGRTTFAGVQVMVNPGVYVPRWQTEPMAIAAGRLLRAGGVALDFCCGSGAIGAYLLATHQRLAVLGTDLDERAVSCARGNGVDAYVGDLDAPLPPTFRGRVDVITAVAPYVPSAALDYLPRDVVRFEGASALDGGTDGLDLVRRIIAVAPRWLAPHGWLFVEVGGDQGAPVQALLAKAGFTSVSLSFDDDGDLRFASGRLP